MGAGEWHILAINSDENAPIMNIAHYAVVGDLYEIIPGLIDSIDCDKEQLYDV